MEGSYFHRSELAVHYFFGGFGIFMDALEERAQTDGDITRWFNRFGLKPNGPPQSPRLAGESRGANINEISSARFEETALHQGGRIKKMYSTQFAQPSPQVAGGSSNILCRVLFVSKTKEFFNPS